MDILHLEMSRSSGDNSREVACIARAIGGSLKKILAECDQEFFTQYLAVALRLEPAADSKLRSVIVANLRNLRAQHGYSGPALLAFEEALIRSEASHPS